jgi:PAS domain-containing protein
MAFPVAGGGRVGALRTLKQLTLTGDPYFAGTLALVVAEAALIAFLLWERSKHVRLVGEREKAAAALKQSEERNRAILSALPDILLILDDNGTYLEWYAANPADLYVPPEMFLGKNMREILPPELAEVFAGHFPKVMSGNPATVEFSLTRDFLRAVS